MVFIRNRFLKKQNVIEGAYSPSPEYPAACRSEAKIPPGGAAGMNGKVNRPTCLDEVGSSSERRRVNFAISFYVGMATAQFRFDTPQLAAGSFISWGMGIIVT